jgi:hypothetical protein
VEGGRWEVEGGRWEVEGGRWEVEGGKVLIVILILISLRFFRLTELT